MFGRGRGWRGRIECREHRFSLLLAAFACVLRPTNVLIWLCLGSFALWNSSGRRRMKLVFEATWIGCCVVFANALLDRHYYGELTFPPIRFLTFNLLQSLAVFYGRSDWHYYLSQGYPLLLTTFLPLVFYGVYTSLRRFDTASPDFQLAATVCVVTMIYSAISHKEVRFVYPLLPMLHVLGAKTLQSLRFSRRSKKLLLGGMVLLNIPVAYYASYVHQRGVVDVIDHLRQSPTENFPVGFLMPCHSTPWISSLGHPPPSFFNAGGEEGNAREMWALGCEPPVNIPVADREAYLDEADEFYADPVVFVKKYIGESGGGGTGEEGEDGKTKRYVWPKRLVVFQQMVRPGGGLWEIVGEKYDECWRGFNSHFHDDWRRNGDVIVFCLKG